MDTVYSAEITDMSFPDGYGVARHGGLVVFTPGCVTGDKAKIKIVKHNNRFAYGELLQIESPSPFRITPLCPHFGLCGGCTMQNISYEAQLKQKENYLEQTLKRIGRIDTCSVKKSPFVPSVDKYFYRGKIELAFGGDGKGITLGMRKRASFSENYSWEVIPAGFCNTFSKNIKNILPIFEEFACKNNLSVYNPQNGKGFLRHLILRESKSTGDLMVIIETTNGKMPDMNGLWKSLTGEVPNVKSLYRIINNGTGDAIRYERSFKYFGNPFITESLGDMFFRIYPASFFQPNPKTANLLYTALAEYANGRGVKSVLGLYCGTGTIEIFLSRYAQSVIGVDSSYANIAAAEENRQMNGIKNCIFREGMVEDVLKTLNYGHIDVIVADPPREGISKQGLSLLIGINPESIAYVSCNPSTLARDIKELSAHGYRLSEIVPFDFFPHTSHMETLAIIENNSFKRHNGH